ncbi:ATP-binding cassette domain-containing protein [Aquabacterium sp. J223]|uniref:ATP-binding cassette domain-containing protein n=1 Tax=Aquabacterium sp. J223 TaxID=2898431 RepID=UPI0021AD5204|nr:ATP-binding cassette domain-containing protein [Aquabacterium sp. J223]UUX94186.1 ATP-binding cassette domain-containing protein [Aquabacterium sp. J223]
MQPRTRVVLSGLWAAVWRFRTRTLLALALLLAAKAAAVSVPLLLKEIVDQFSRPETLTGTLPLPAGTAAVMVLPVFLLLGYALLRFVTTLFNELRDIVFARVTQRTMIDFAERSFAHLLALSARFHTRRNTGSLIRDLERGTAGIGFLLGAGVFTIVPTLVEFVAVLVVMARGYSLWFTLIIFVTFVVYGGYTTTMTHRREVRQRRVNQMDSSANGRMVDTLMNYETVKVYAREPFERRRYADICGLWVEHSVRNQYALSALHIGQSAIIACGVAAVMLLAAQQTLQGAMTVGDLVLVNSFILQICLPLNALGFVFREARDALVNTEKLFDLLEQPPDIVDAPGARPLAVSGGGIAFDDVQFAYEPGRPILHGISLAVPAGKTVAVVGGSGSGKSTLARLLLRLYEPQGGRITIDGQDLREVSLASLRDAIGVVPQDTVLFNDSIAYNIGYGRPGASLSEIIEAARAAQVHEFIESLPEGYDTLVGERGTKLSGGEKQRIAIARAFLKNPPIMVFDEATSALDTRAERAIQGELDRIAQGRSTLIIAHRLSTIVNADEIVVLDRGRIVERGRHDDLLALGGLYAQLWSLQRQQQQVERLERRLAQQPVNLALLIGQAIDGLREAIEARGVQLYTDLDLDNAGVTGDPGTLAQVVREVCMHAVQATPVDGRIQLALERHETDVRFSVTDGRHGAAPGQRLRLVGTGDGSTLHGLDTPLDPLSLRSTLERQGGRFYTEPPTGQRGMRYVMELPLRALSGEPASRRPVEPSVPGGVPLAPAPLTGLQVLCIDDRADARESLELLLQAEGAATVAFASGSAAIAWLESRTTAQWPHLIVCDIALGEEDGHAVIRRVRQIEAQRKVPLEQRIPAVALTGLAQAGDRIRALMAGFQVHLAKPVAPDALIAALLELSGRRGPPSSGHPREAVA